MAVMTTTLQNAVLNQILGGVAYTPPATVYVGLATNTVAPSADGHDLTEASGGSYQRFAVANNTTNWPSATVNGSGGYDKKNGIQINFPTSSPTVGFSASAGTATYWFIASDNNPVGTSNIMFFGAISPTQSLATNNMVDFPANTGLTITLD